MFVVEYHGRPAFILKATLYSTWHWTSSQYVVHYQPGCSLRQVSREIEAYRTASELLFKLNSGGKSSRKERTAARSDHGLQAYNVFFYKKKRFADFSSSSSLRQFSQVMYREVSVRRAQRLPSHVSLSDMIRHGLCHAWIHSLIRGRT